MTDETAVPDFLEIRRALLRAVRGSSRRKVAREVGISPTTLGEIADGRSKPYGKTVEKLMIWYTHAGSGAVADDAAVRRMGIAIATRSLTPESRRTRVAELVTRILDRPTDEVLEHVESVLPSR